MTESSPPPCRYGEHVEAERWMALAAAVWRPVVTFTRRRLDLLDWIEANVLDDVLSFTDAPTHFGVELRNDLQRMRLERTAVRVELLSNKARLETLRPAIAKTLDLFGADEPVPGVYFGMWTVSLNGDYDDLRGRLARSLSSDWPEDFTPFDAAPLMDAKTPVGMIKAEYGVVTDVEMHARLNGNSGRTAQYLGAPHVHTSVTPKDLPDVALCIEASCSPFFDAPISGYEDFEGFVGRVEETVQALALALASRLES